MSSFRCLAVAAAPYCLSIAAFRTPLSGLAFHPLEAALYFSSLPLMAALVPMTAALYAAAKWGLLLSPVLTHCGFSAWVGDAAAARGGKDPMAAHHAHHRLGTGNFGGVLPWDWLCGTQIKAKPTRRGDLHPMDAIAGNPGESYGRLGRLSRLSS